MTMSYEESFRVHLESLLAFARELEDQLEAMRRPTDSMGQLRVRPVLLGEFGEASSLADRHRAAAEQMHDLLHTVRAAIAFANDVTRMIADGYADYDVGVATSFRVHGKD
ncbi:hypothetical protein ONA91_15890 [Micromonospora sp. DR5-3]|uniref:hypothetical protein n=1 Tax=unclassified Micromonospora TaxID=2617518 RepID=UPI0011DBB5BE|nr:MULTISPECIES: hypothetical protein [unclassified Micromonospora]MCW3815925.1 hypothetical protein [Micromonospora sp. DR5-3]TYC24425.1 hypothetical protein FXF52_10520 [Micromonospora sp. MP36]